MRPNESVVEMDDSIILDEGPSVTFLNQVIPRGFVTVSIEDNLVLSFENTSDIFRVSVRKSPEYTKLELISSPYRVMSGYLRVVPVGDSERKTIKPTQSL